MTKRRKCLPKPFETKLAFIIILVKVIATQIVLKKKIACSDWTSKIKPLKKWLF